MHHVHCDVAPLAVSPRIAHADRLFHDYTAVFRNALLVERGLSRQPLRSMRRAFAGDHALAEQHFGPLHRAFFYEIVVLYHQHFANVFGMVQKNNVMMAEFVVRDVAIGLGEMLKQQDGIGRLKLPEGEPEQVALKAGREAVIRPPARGAAIGPSSRCRHSASLRRLERGVKARVTVNRIERLPLPQLIEFSHDFFTVPDRIHAGVDLCDFSVGIDEKRMPRRNLQYSQICQRTVGAC